MEMNIKGKKINKRILQKQTEDCVAKILKEDNQERAATYLARQLLRQIQSRDKQCAFWIISAIHKLKYDGASIVCVLNILKQEMPKAFAKYAEYTRNT
jgi:hypothetical protein